MVLSFLGGPRTFTLPIWSSGATHPGVSSLLASKAGAASDPGWALRWGQRPSLGCCIPWAPGWKRENVPWSAERRGVCRTAGSHSVCLGENWVLTCEVVVSGARGRGQTGSGGFLEAAESGFT